MLPDLQVYCLENCSDHDHEKNVPVIEISFFKFEAECREFAKMMRSPEQFIGTVKGQNIFLKQDTF